MADNTDNGNVDELSATQADTCDKINTCADAADANVKNDDDAKNDDEAKNDKQCPTATEKLSELEMAIVKQMEYYFSDINLARDIFLKEQMKLDYGWIPITTLLTFKRLASITEKADVIIDTLKKAKISLIEIHSDNTKIRRDPNLDVPERNEEFRKECLSRSAYVKGFPDANKTDLSDLIKYFEQYNQVVNVIMRRYQDISTKEYRFKGSVFVTFATKEQCAEFLKIEKIEYNGIELQKKWQTDYYESKKAERLQKNQDKRKSLDNGENIVLPSGAIIHLDGLTQDTSRESIKEVITKLGVDVAYIDYERGNASGHVRLVFENSAKSLLEKLDDSAKIKIDNADVNVRILEGDEEQEFLTKVRENMKSKKFHSRPKGGRGNFNRKRKSVPSKEDEPVEKRETKAAA